MSKQLPEISWKRIADLEAANARLQERVAEAEDIARLAQQTWNGLEARAKRAEALAERRKEALDEGVKHGRTAMEVKALVEGHHSSCRWYPALEKWECHPILCERALAAIEEERKR